MRIILSKTKNPKKLFSFHKSKNDCIIIIDEPEYIVWQEFLDNLQNLPYIEKITLFNTISNINKIYNTSMYTLIKLNSLELLNEPVQEVQRQMILEALGI